MKTKNDPYGLKCKINPKIFFSTKGFPKGGVGGEGGSAIWEKFPKNTVFLPESPPNLCIWYQNIQPSMRTNRLFKGFPSGREDNQHICVQEAEKHQTTSSCPWSFSNRQPHQVHQMERKSFAESFAKYFQNLLIDMINSCKTSELMKLNSVM